MSELERAVKSGHSSPYGRSSGLEEKVRRLEERVERLERQARDH